MKNPNMEEVHKAVSEILQKVYDDHGIRIENIEGYWLDCSNVSEKDFKLVELSIKSKSDPS